MGKGLIRLWSGTAVKPQVQSTCSPGLPGDAGAAASGASGWCARSWLLASFAHAERKRRSRRRQGRFDEHLTF